MFTTFIFLKSVTYIYITYKKKQYQWIILILYIPYQTAFMLIAISEKFDSSLLDEDNSIWGASERDVSYAIRFLFVEVCLKALFYSKAYSRHNDSHTRPTDFPSTDNRGRLPRTYTYTRTITIPSFLLLMSCNGDP